jgi:glycerol-3-phosphate dehydrogenase (NAD(P)+)
MAENAPESSRPAVFSRAQASLTGRRAVVIGAGSFGTAIAVLLARAGVRATLQTRTSEQATTLGESRENDKYLPGVELPAALRIEPLESGVSRADFVFLAVPSTALGEVVASIAATGLGRPNAVVSLCKGLVPPDGATATAVLRTRFGAHRTACIGGPAHAQEMVHHGAALVAASLDEQLAEGLAAIFTRAGVVCEISSDPVGVELAAVAKNAAALAAGATEAQGLNAAGAAAGHIFAEVWRYAAASGAQPESLIGLAGAGDLVATALAPQSRNRRAGELLAQGVGAEEIERQVGQAVEALESVRLLAKAVQRGGFPAPVTVGLSRLISGELPLEDWVALVRTTVPMRSGRRTWWRRLRG